MEDLTCLEQFFRELSQCNYASKLDLSYSNFPSENFSLLFDLLTVSKWEEICLDGLDIPDDLFQTLRKKQL